MDQKPEHNTDAMSSIQNDDIDDLEDFEGGLGRWLLSILIKIPQAM